jgi:hypothetical protein
MSDETIEPVADVTSSHTTGRMSGRIEIVGRVSGRRRWTVEQKLAILRDAFGPDGSVRAAVERHEVSSGDPAIAGLRFRFAPPPPGNGSGDDNALTNYRNHPVGAAHG